MLKNEVKKIICNKNLYIALVIGLFSCLSGLFSYYDTASYAYANGRPERISAYNAWLDCLSIGSSVYRLLLPLLITPFLDSYYIERKSGYQNLVLTRSSRIKYFLTKWFAGVLSVVGIVIIILGIALLACVILFPLNSPLAETSYLHKNFGLYYFLENPIGYIVLLIFSNIFFAICYYTIGFSSSNFVYNRSILLLVPFLLYIIQLVVSQIFSIPVVSPLVFIAYYELRGLTPEMMIAAGVVYVLITLVMLSICYYLDKCKI